MTRLRLLPLTLVATITLVVAGMSPALSARASQTAATETLRVLVTNDDGVAAPGIAVVVDALQALPDVEVTVIAPATNQSGSGDNFSTGAITVSPATTASGDAATAVAGFPADSVLYGVLSAMSEPPHVVVSGSNLGQNLGNPIASEVSGTVGAALTANRLGIPAIALSNGLGSNIKYGTAASAAAFWLAALRDTYTNGTAPVTTVNVNVPTCTTGVPRGLVFLPLGYAGRVSGYTLTSGTIGNGTLQPTVVAQNPVATPNCRSTLTNPTNDIEAFNNGFITITGLDRDLTS
jgi:5'-nucleotidase